jgi:hypothetical protein
VTVVAAYRGRVGEHKPVRIARALGAASLVLGAAVVLTSCSALGAPGSAGTATDVPVATSTPLETAVASPEPTASSTPVVTPTPTAAADGRAAVTLAITTPPTVTAGQSVDLAALVTQVIEGDGTCTFTLTSGSSEKTYTSPGVSASSYTACQAVSVKDLAAGTWRLVVKYSSPKSVGSATETVTVG